MSPGFPGEYLSVWQEGRCRIGRLRVARSFFLRARGLMFRPEIPEEWGEGLIFPRCRDLHSFGMRFPLDVLWTDDRGNLIGLRRGVPPGKILRGPAAACHVLEARAGALDSFSGAPLEFLPPAG